MIDPLAEVVTLLRPGATLSKTVSGAGRWRLRRTDAGQPFYCIVLQGCCRVAPGDDRSVTLESGDFVLIPSAQEYTVSSFEEPPAADGYVSPVVLPGGDFRLGARNGPPEVVMLVGHCVFGSPDAALLVSLLPNLVHVRGETRLATLVQLIGDESRAVRPARDVVLARLLEVLLIEAFRSASATGTSPGLLRGLGDARLATAFRRMHERPSHPWSVAGLAREAALSRSAFFERFGRAVGVPPMAYLLAWRMALAKTLLQVNGSGIADIAERVGYRSASTFSVAFTRHVGMPPAHYARAHART